METWHKDLSKTHLRREVYQCAIIKTTKAFQMTMFQMDTTILSCQENQTEALIIIGG